MKTNWLKGATFALLIFSALGMVHSVRALVAQSFYHYGRYGEGSKKSPLRIAAACAKAHKLYPYNYNFCIWAGKQAFYGRYETNDVAAVELLIQARLWSDAAHTLNPRNSEAVHLKAEVLALDSLDEAILLWEDYVNWCFWEPFNQWVLFDLYERAGRLEQAEMTMYWLQETEYAERAESMLRSAWARKRRKRDG
ncbi:MAG: hypothetical protein ISS35_01860 [Kiritimatiellae bacterium]|nr:hypothetical protein [Kiritimatiellia bacterium]